jgi:hypothetical protein
MSQRTTAHCRCFKRESTQSKTHHAGDAGGASEVRFDYSGSAQYLPARNGCVKLQQQQLRQVVMWAGIFIVFV